MSKSEIRCCVCQKQFSATYNLAKHARKYHAEQVSLIIPKKTYNYQCTQCHKNFSQLKNLNFHKRKHHSENLSSDASSAAKNTQTECPICKLAAPKENLITHFEAEHDIKCETQTIEFISFEEFSAWKTDMEYNTKSKYLVERGFQCTKDGTRTIKYCCHRSGKYVACGKGSRHLKAQGSKKIGGFCPARLKVIIDKNNHCKVFFTDQHVGHDENDLRHLSLTPPERMSLASKIALKMPFSQILDDVRDSVGSQLERIHLLTRKDLSNIERSFHLQSTGVRCTNDAGIKQRGSSGYVLPQDEHIIIINEDSNASEVSEIVTSVTLNEVAQTRDDDKQVASEIQNLIDNFTQLMGSVTSMEQVDAVKKVCNSLGPTLEAIAMKKQPGQPSTSVCSSSNKKIYPQRRGKLYSTKKKTPRAVALVTATNEMREIAMKPLFQ